ncbi:hypothetical protein LTR66_013799 [Elasticomyces elasticus]|nr:hypothetical protein LTR66_013799 [Elasticomyces elasticus]
MNGAGALAEAQQRMQQQNMNIGQGQQAVMPNGRQLPPGVPIDLQHKLAALPEDQLARFIAQWKQGGAQSFANGLPNAQHIMQQGGPQMPPQGFPNGIPQHPGQAANTAGLGQNMPNGQQQGPGPAVGSEAQMQQKLLQQRQRQRQQMMDQMPFPRPFTAQLFPMPIPPEVKTFGQLKLFTQQNIQSLPQPQNLMGKLMQLQNSWAQKHLASRQLALEGQPQPGPALAPNQPPPTGMQINMPTGQAPQAQMVPTPAPQNQGPPRANMPGNGPQLPFAPPSAQEIQEFRMKVPNGQSFTEEQIRQRITQLKYQQLQRANPALFHQHQQQQAALRQAQMLQQSRGQQMNAAALQTQLQAQDQRSGAMNQAQQQGPRPQMPQPGRQQGQPTGAKASSDSKKRQSGSEDVVEIENPNQPSPKPAQAPPMQQTRSQQPRPPNHTLEQMPGTTPEQRASHEDQQRNQVREAQIEAIRRAQQQSQLAQPPQMPRQQPVNDAQGRLRTTMPMGDDALRAQWLRDRLAEVEASCPKGPVVQLSEEDFKFMVQRLKLKTVGLISQVDKTLQYGFPFLGDDIMKRVLKMRQMLVHQVNSKTGEVLDYFSIRKAELEELELRLNHYMRNLAQHMDRRRAAQQMPQGGDAHGQHELTPGQRLQYEQAQQQQQQQLLLQQQQQQRQQQQQQQQQQLQQQQQQQQQPFSQANNNNNNNMQQVAAQNLVRTNPTQQHRRRNSKAPAAPTSAAPPFPLGEPSPHGIPMYGADGLTQDKLKFPPQKKRKGPGGQPTSAVSTPAQQGTTPSSMDTSPLIGAGKMPSASPEQKKGPMKTESTPPETVRKEAERRFKCLDPDCETSVHGFEKEEELKSHTEEAHKPIEDPLQFFLECVAEALDVDLDGNPRASKPAPDAPKSVENTPLQPKVKSETQKTVAVAKSESSMPNAKRETLTPGSSGVAAAATTTPMLRQQSAQQPIKPSPGSTPANTLKTPQPLKQSTNTPTAPAPEPAPRKTLRQTLMERAGYTPPAPARSSASNAAPASGKGRQVQRPHPLPANASTWPTSTPPSTDPDNPNADIDPISLSFSHDINAISRSFWQEIDATPNFAGQCALWGLRPDQLSPATATTTTTNTSPSSEGRGSEGRDSDVGPFDRLELEFDWSVFGDGGEGSETADSRAREGFVEVGRADVEMGGMGTGGGKVDAEHGGVERAEGQRRGRRSARVDWDAMFGPESGLEDGDPEMWRRDDRGGDLFGDARFEALE